MLAALAIANYRSLRDVLLPLAPLNIGTGPNGSGKSTFTVRCGCWRGGAGRGGGLAGALRNR